MKSKLRPFHRHFFACVFSNTIQNLPCSGPRTRSRWGVRTGMRTCARLLKQNENRPDGAATGPWSYLVVRSCGSGRARPPRSRRARSADGSWSAHGTCVARDDLRRDPLEVRKPTLASVLANAAPGLRYNDHIEHDDGETVFRHACKLGSKASSRSGRIRPIAAVAPPIG